MTPEFHHLRFGEQVELDLAGRGGFHLIYGGGRAVTASTRSGCSLWVPLRGQLILETPEGVARLTPRNVLLWSDGPVRVSARSVGVWLALSASAASWQQVLVDRSPDRHPVIYSGEYAASRQLMRVITRLARRARSSSVPGSPLALLEAIGVLIVDLQQPIEALTTHCAGNTLARRRQTLLRLLRTRNRIRMNPTYRLDLATLARSANYSPSHFIRSFREVFGYTPYDYGIRTRLEHARRLIEFDGLSVTEAANLAGYDSRAGFSRSFRDAFGVTASTLRRATDAE